MINKAVTTIFAGPSYLPAALCARFCVLAGNRLEIFAEMKKNIIFVPPLYTLISPTNEKWFLATTHGPHWRTKEVSSRKIDTKGTKLHNIYTTTKKLIIFSVTLSDIKKQPASLLFRYLSFWAKIHMARKAV